MPGNKLGGGDDLNAEGFDQAEQVLVIGNNGRSSRSQGTGDEHVILQIARALFPHHGWLHQERKFLDPRQQAVIVFAGERGAAADLEILGQNLSRHRHLEASSCHRGKDSSCMRMSMPAGSDERVGVNDNRAHRPLRWARTSAQIVSESGAFFSPVASIWAKTAWSSAAGSSAKAFHAALRSASEMLAKRPAATSESSKVAICGVKVTCAVWSLVAMSLSCHLMA